MSETNYWSELSKDIAGATSSGLEAFFKEISKIQDDFVNGKITHTTVVAAATKFEALALFMERTRESVLTSQAALGEALTPSQQSFDRRWQQTIRELKSVSQIWRQADAVAAVRNFGANAAKSFGLIGQILTLSEVGDALIKGDGKALAGALGGWVGGALGAALGAGVATTMLASGPPGWAALVVIGVTASAVSYVGSDQGKSLGLSTYQAFTDYQARRTVQERINGFLAQIDQAYGATSPTAQQARTQLADAVDKLGRLDGTWMQGFSSMSNQEKANLTALLIGSAMGQAPDAMRADLLKVFEFDWGSGRLPLRDAVIDVLAALVGSTAAYADSVVETDSAGHILVHVENMPEEEGYRLSTLIELYVDEADQAGVPLRPFVDTIIFKAGDGPAVGSSADDALIGSVTDDSLLGGEGHDYLAGGIGADTLRGGAGSDVLLGGAGGDELDGGEGRDYLYGGAGSDTYAFTGDFGNDWINDSDGSGQITVDGQTLSAQNAKKVSTNTYKDKSTGWTFFKGDVQTDGTATLVISKEGARNSNITVRNWKSGQMGITLSDTQEEAPTGLSVFKGDQRPLIYGVELIESGATDNTYAWGKVTRDPATGTLQGQAKAEADFADVFYGTDSGDDIQGLGGNDALNGGAGKDKIDGGTGNDLIGGGSGSDTILGGAGNDQILSGNSINVPQRRSPSDKWTVPPDAKSVIISGPTWGVYELKDKLGEYSIVGVASTLDDQPDYIDGGAGDDRILASRGNDYVNGGDDKDGIEGLAGADLLYGGAGDDHIEGDGIVKPGYLETTAAELHGNDLLDGGAGNDTLMGQGGNDMLFGGDGLDRLWGDTTEENFPTEAHGEDTLDGGAGEDQIIGGGKDDLAYGGAGNDSLWGDGKVDEVAASVHGDDTLDGGIGDDQLIGGGRNDLLIGDQGKDNLWGDDAADRVPEAAHGRDTLQGGQGDDNMVGGGDADQLMGGDDNDKLWGDDTGTHKLDVSFHGADYLDGGKGNDQLIGGGKDDTLIGGDGADSLWGDGTSQDIDAAAHGKDYLSGGLGKDQMTGGGEADKLHGGEDNDLIFGDDLESIVSASAHGNDLLYGDGGLDTLIGGGKDDTLFGGNGNDTLWGDDLSKNLGVAAHGKDQLYGGDGADQLFGGGSDDQLFGGAGADMLSGDDLVANVAGGAHGADFLDGGADNDTLFGDGGNDTLMGGAGDDFLAGEHQTSSAVASQGSTLQGDDLLMGEDGNDVLLGGEGRDTLDGGSGNDTLIGGAGADEYRFGIGSGSDTVYLESTDSIADTIQLESGLKENDIVFSRTSSDLMLKVAGSTDQLTLMGFFNRDVDVIRFGDNTVNIGSNLASKTFVSTANADTLSGYSEGEFIFGDAGNDQISSNDGNDTLDGGSGNDILRGGRGADTYLFGIGSGQDTIINDDADAIGTNEDTIALGAGLTDTSITVRRVANDLQLRINAKDDKLVVQNYFVNDGASTSAPEILRFADGKEWRLTTLKAAALTQTAGSDTLEGFASNDTINGGDGNDFLYGREGDDVLDGGPGNDYLMGNAGRDTYLFGLGSGQDTLWSDGNQDSIQMTGALKSEELTFTISQRDLIINIRGTNDQLLVREWISVYDEDYRQPSSFMQIVFPDGKTLKRSDILERIFTGTAQDESIVATELSEKISGLAGNDSITAKAGDDTLVGGEGNDTLDGGWGANTYIFKSGDGSDFIKSHTGANDRIIFDDAIDPRQVVLTWNELVLAPWTTAITADLVIQIGNAGDRIYVSDFMRHAGSVTTFTTLKELRFKNETWDLEKILEKIRETTPTAGGLILGGSGADSLNGTNDRDKIHGGAGNDTIDGKGGDDSVYGGLGENTYIFRKGSGSDTILSRPDNQAFSGKDTLLLEGLNPEDVVLSSLAYWSSAGVIRIQIKETMESIDITDFFAIDASKYRRSPVERIVFANAVTWDYKQTMAALYAGSGGDDSIAWTPYGESADVHVGDGDDKVITSNGNDTISGGRGDDSLFGGSGSNVFKYEIGDGNDTISLPSSADVASVDALYFGKGIFESDIFAVIGPQGDTPFYDPTALYLLNKKTAELVKISNYRTYRGANKPDLMPTFSIVFDNGAVWDRDKISNVASTNPGTTNLGSSWNDEMTVSGPRVELYGLSGNDTLTGASTNDSLFGGKGNDSLIGMGGNDVLQGHADSDTLEGGLGQDALYGGAGSDTYVYNKGDGYDVIYGQRTEDTLRMKGFKSTDVTFNRQFSDISIAEASSGTSYNIVTLVRQAFDGTHEFTGVSQIVFDDKTLSADEIRKAALKGTSGHDTNLRGYISNDTINGFDGNDSLYGEGGNDQLNGGLGKDLLDGGTGADTMTGGQDDDTYWVDSRQDAVIEYTDGGNDTIIALGDQTVLTDHVETLWLQGTVAKTGWGNASDNVIFGNTRSNTLGGDTGDDIILAGRGSDLLSGGPGADQLMGEAGNDTYQMSMSDGHDLIYNNDSVGFDTLRLFDATKEQIWLRRSENDLVVEVLGNDQAATIGGWFQSQSLQLDQIKLGFSGPTLNTDKVAGLVQAMASLSPPPGGLSSLSQADQARIQSAIQTAWI